MTNKTSSGSKIRELKTAGRSRVSTFRSLTVKVKVKIKIKIKMEMELEIKIKMVESLSYTRLLRQSASSNKGMKVN